MKDNVQNRIDQYIQLAKSHGVPGQKKVSKKDSLSKVIRNAREAAIFLHELDALEKKQRVCS